MGLKITRTQGDGEPRPSATPSLSSNTSSVWSARDLCPLEIIGHEKPTFSEQVTADANGRLGTQQISELFDRLWKLSRDRSRVIAQLDMANVKETDSAFERELEFFRRELQRRGGDVLVINFK